jgi:hypothetical protein
MKAKLVKTENGYGLEDVEIIAFYSSKRPEHKHYKLSKQNCDEIFGVIDVDDMMKNILSNCSKTKQGYILGFKMAMALNKDKLFTLEDLETVWDRSADYRHNPTHENSLQECIKSLQQPTEIEVEIVMGDSIGIGDKYTPDNFPKLDEDGCLILKRKL